MTSSVSEKVRQALVHVLDIDLDPDSIDDRLPLYSTTIGMDSLTLLQVIMELERIFSCEIDDEAMMTADLVDVGSLINLVITQLESAKLHSAHTDR